MATTGAGSPYVTGTDNITGYPTTSLALANRVDAVESGAAAALTSGLAAKYDNAPAINAQTGTTYTFVLADATAGKTITASNAAASTYTVPPQSSVTFVAGALLRVTNLGAGVVTFAGGSGVTVTNAAATLRQYQSATLVRTGSDAWTVSADIASGMDLITPTSVAGSGVTLSGGAVSFSASSTVSVNGCFTSAYENYYVVLSGSATGSAVAASIRLRASGTDDSASSYKSILMFVEPSLSAGRNSGTSLQCGRFDSTGDSNALAVEILRPQIANRTIFMATNATPYLGGLAVVATGSFDATTQFDGFTVFPASGTITGTLRVYGRRN